MNSVVIRGVRYRSYVEAAKAHGVTPSAVHKAKLRGTLSNVGLGPKVSNADRLLDWMTHHHLPLEIFREKDGPWVVVDGSADTVLGSGGNVQEALAQAYRSTAHEREAA